MARIYLSPPHLSGEEFELVREAFETNWISPVGPHVDGLEREVCEKLGVPHAAALSSGTAALHLALMLLGVDRGDEVLCSTFTFAASANVVTYVGANPVFVDADRQSWCIDPELVADDLAARARKGRLPAAVMAVDLYGQCADYGVLADVCAEYEVPLLEDAAESLGASHRGRAAGGFGAAAALSFNGNKIITSGGGGMLVSHDGELVEKARFLATQARDPAPHYQHTHIGYNYRLSNVLAGIGRGQVRALDDRVARRREINQLYRCELADIPGLSFMPEAPNGTCTFWLTCIQIDEELGVEPETIRQHLETLDIEARPVWKPMHLQPVFQGCRVIGGKVSSSLFRRGLCLPSGTAMTDEQVEWIAGEVRGCLID